MAVILNMVKMVKMVNDGETCEYLETCKYGEDGGGGGGGVDD